MSDIIISNLRGTRSSTFGLRPAAAAGAPTTGAFTLGELWLDADGIYWRCTIAGSPGTWEKLDSNMVSVLDVDTTDGYLNDKIVGGDGIEVVPVDTGGFDFVLEINNIAPDTKKVLVSDNDTTEGLLSVKIVGGDYIDVTVTNPTGNEILTIDSYYTVEGATAAASAEANPNDNDFIPLIDGGDGTLKKHFYENLKDTIEGVIVTSEEYGKVLTNGSDISPDFLVNKLVASAGIGISVTDTGGGNLKALLTSDYFAIGITKTVKASGGDFTTITSAIAWFSGKVCISCVIDVEAGSYTEIFAIGNYITDNPANFVLRGDTRSIVGISYIHGEPVNAGGIANAGATGGVVTLTQSGNTVTVSVAGGNPNFGTAGITNGDKVYCRSTSGTYSEMTVSSVSTNAITFTGAPPTVNAAGGSITLLPNRRLISTGGGTGITINATCQIKGFTFVGNSSYYNIYTQSAYSIISNTAHIGGYAAIGAMGAAASIVATNTPNSMCNMGTYGIIAQFGAMIQLLYSYVCGCGGTGFGASYGGILWVQGSYAVGAVTGFSAGYHSIIHASSGGATKCTTGFNAAYNSYIAATSTQANTNSKGNTADYSPASSDTEGNVSAIITRS